MTSGPHIACEFDDNAVVQDVVGAQSENLLRLEQRLGVNLILRGNIISIEGDHDQAIKAQAALMTLYKRAAKGHVIDKGDVDAAARLTSEPADTADLTLRTRKKHVAPRTPGQATFLRLMNEHELVFALGPAGTGKTYLAVAKAVAMKIAGQVDKIILSRPAVEAGERLGFLPGDMKEKVDPYLRPLYDALFDMLPGDQVARNLESGDIEVAPLAFMRGRTLSNAFVILDEAQNTTPVQMKMFLTRLGERSRMVVNGDLSQIDLPPGARSGLEDALDILKGVNGVGRIAFTSADVVRHDLVSRIVEAYDAASAAKPGKR
jgi:phosphate starvation-inducible PhoH-like protein